MKNRAVCSPVWADWLSDYCLLKRSIKGCCMSLPAIQNGWWAELILLIYLEQDWEGTVVQANARLWWCTAVVGAQPWSQWVMFTGEACVCCWIAMFASELASGSEGEVKVIAIHFVRLVFPNENRSSWKYLDSCRVSVSSPPRDPSQDARCGPRIHPSCVCWSETHCSVQVLWAKRFISPAVEMDADGDGRPELRSLLTCCSLKSN